MATSINSMENVAHSHNGSHGREGRPTACAPLKQDLAANNTEKYSRIPFAYNSSAGKTEQQCLRGKPFCGPGEEIKGVTSESGRQAPRGVDGTGARPAGSEEQVLCSLPHMVYILMCDPLKILF